MERPSIVQVTDLTPAEADERAHEESAVALDRLETVSVENEQALEYLRDLAKFVVARDR